LSHASAAGPLALAPLPAFGFTSLLAPLAVFLALGEATRALSVEGGRAEWRAAAAASGAGAVGRAVGNTAVEALAAAAVGATAGAAVAAAAGALADSAGGGGGAFGDCAGGGGAFGDCAGSLADSNFAGVVVPALSPVLASPPPVEPLLALAGVAVAAALGLAATAAFVPRAEALAALVGMSEIANFSSVIADRAGVSLSFFTPFDPPFGVNCAFLAPPALVALVVATLGGMFSGIAEVANWRAPCSCGPAR